MSTGRLQPQNAQTVFNGNVPAEGRKVFPQFLDFTLNGSYVVDLTYAIQTQQVSQIQTIFVDNSGNSNPVYIITSITNQNQVVPPNSMAYLPVLETSQPQVTITTTGSLILPIQLLNFAVAPIVWSAVSANANVVGGKLQVQDTALEALINGTNYNVFNHTQNSGEDIAPDLNADMIYNNSVTTTTTANIIAPASPESFFFNQFLLRASSNATVAAAGRVGITIADGGTTIFSTEVFLPTTVPTYTQPTADIEILNLQGSNYRSRTAGNALTITINTALTSGSILWYVRGGKYIFV